MLIPQWLVSQVDHFVKIQIGHPKSDGFMRRLLVTAHKWFRKRWSHERTTLDVISPQAICELIIVPLSFVRWLFDANVIATRIILF